MLKHDHEHVPYFPAKNCSRSSSAWYGSQFLNRTYCMVPRRNWTKLRGLTLPLSDFLLELCGRILPDHFRAPDTCWKTTRPWASNHNFLSNSSWGARQSRWRPNSDINLVTFTYGFWEKRVRSLDLPPPLAASALIVEPNARGLHDLECLMTFLQNFSAVATS